MVANGKKTRLRLRAEEDFSRMLHFGPAIREGGPRRPARPAIPSRSC
jgi:hypothetical protein